MTLGTPDAVAVTAGGSAAPPDAPGRGWRLRGIRRGELLALGFLLMLVLMCALGPVFSQDPLQQQLDDTFASPSGAHWLGTDDTGRDVLSRLLSGGRTTLLASLLATVIAIVIGLPLGLLAGYFGSVVDVAIGRVLDAFMAIPAIVLAVVCASILGGGVYGAMASVGVIFAPLIARLVRAEVLRARESLYVEALRSLGVPQRRIVVRHMIPNSIQPVIVQSSLVLAYALIAEASLSFLGFGVQPPDPSWGGMLGRAYASINQHAWQIYVPGLTITLTVLSINTLGNYLRRSLLRTID